MTRPLITPQNRKYAYRIAWAGLVLLSARGIVAAHELPLWQSLAAALFGVADAHTDPTTPTGQPRAEYGGD